MASNGNPLEGEVETEEIPAERALDRSSIAEIEQQIRVARQYPRWSARRGIDQFQREVVMFGSVDEDTAESCFYALKRRERDGHIKVISGASIRAAEIALANWRNVHAAGRFGRFEDQHVIGQGMCWDLESNYKVGMETPRRITDRFGRRYGDDMLIVTSNAAIAIALRNAIFKVIPIALLKRPLEEIKKVSLGKALTLAARRDRMIERMKEVGASLEEMLDILERKSISDMTLDDLYLLAGMRSSIREQSGTTWTTIMADWRKGKEKTDEEVKRDMRSGLDDTELAEDQSKPVDSSPDETHSARESNPSSSPAGAATGAADVSSTPSPTTAKAETASEPEAGGSAPAVAPTTPAVEAANDENAPLTEDDRKRASEYFRTAKGRSSTKTKALMVAIPGYTTPRDLRNQRELDLFFETLGGMRGK